MHQVQRISTTCSVVVPAHAPDLRTFVLTARARLNPRMDVLGYSREWQTGQNDSAHDEGKRRTVLLPWQVKRVRDYVDTDLHGRVSLSMAASHARLSRAYFSRCFRQSFGVTFSRFVAGRRVDRAQGLMTDGVGKLCEIALACGFADQAHFTRTFSDLVGCSPARWRRQAAVSRLPV
jgi:AraC family transcriptional regulator